MSTIKLGNVTRVIPIKRGKSWRVEVIESVCYGGWVKAKTEEEARRLGLAAAENREWDICSPYDYKVNDCYEDEVI